MDFTEWIQKDADTDVESLLDPERYSRIELRKDKSRIEQERTRLETELSKLNRKYKRLLEKGSNAPDSIRHNFAFKARQVKKEVEQSQRQYEEAGVKLTILIIIEALREISDTQDEDQDDLVLESVMAEPQNDSNRFKTSISEQMAQYDLDSSAMQEARRKIGNMTSQTDTEEPSLRDRIMKSMADQRLTTEDIQSIQDTLEIQTESEDTTQIEEQEVMHSIEATDNDIPSLNAEDPEMGEIDIDTDPVNIDLDIPSEIDGDDDLVWTNVYETEDDRLEIDIHTEADQTVRIRDFDTKVSTIWAIEIDVQDFVEIVSDVFSMPDTTRIEARRETEDETIVHETGTIGDLEAADWFPDDCKYLVLEVRSAEIRWGNDPGHSTFEITVTGSGLTAESVVVDSIRETLRDELSTETLEALMGQTGYVLDEYPLADTSSNSKE